MFGVSQSGNSCYRAVASKASTGWFWTGCPCTRLHTLSVYTATVAPSGAPRHLLNVFGVDIIECQHHTFPLQTSRQKNTSSEVATCWHIPAPSIQAKETKLPGDTASLPIALLMMARSIEPTPGTSHGPIVSRVIELWQTRDKLKLYCRS